VISVESITKRYGDLAAVSDLSFEVPSGEVVGFLGPNGAGKSTTMKILTGAMQPDAGTVLFDGISIGDDLTAARRRVGYLPETNALYPEMLVSEYLTFACELRGIGGADRTRALSRAVEQTGIGTVFTRPIAELSKGFRQRVGLAAAIVHEPEILVLDEPTEGLDPNQRVGIRRLVNELGRERTVLLSSHVMAEVEATCRRLLILHQGRLVADGSPSSLLEARSGAPSYVVEIEGEGVTEHLERLPGVTSVEATRVDGRQRLRVVAEGEADLRPVLFRTAADQGWVLWELRRERESLEFLFHELTREGGAP
jgi:ABC-2 type transport system ATP-binding protein